MNSGDLEEYWCARSRIRRENGDTVCERGLKREWLWPRLTKSVGYLVLVGVLSLQGCSAYHGQIRETKSSEVKRVAGQEQKRVAVSLQDGMLIVERFNLHEVDSVPVEITTTSYNQCGYKTLFGKSGDNRPHSLLRVVDVSLAELLGYFFDVLESDELCDRPVVPVLSRVACSVLPLVSCGGVPGGPVVTDVSTKEGSHSTTIERKLVAGSIQIEMRGEREDVHIDPTGIARVPLERYAVAFLLRGEDRISARVTVRE